MWDREDLSWAAGILEGEGSFHLAGSKTPHPVIACMMSDEDVILHLREVLKLGHVNGPYGPYWHKTRQKWTGVKWTYRCSRRAHVYALCAALYPFMGQRRRGQIELAMDKILELGLPKETYRERDDKRERTIRQRQGS